MEDMINDPRGKGYCDRCAHRYQNWCGSLMFKGEPMYFPIADITRCGNFEEVKDKEE